MKIYNKKFNIYFVIFLILLISSFTLCQGNIEIEKPKEPVKSIAEYEKVPSKADILTDSVFVSNNASTMNIKFIDGNLKLSDVIVHNKRDIALLESTLIKELKGYNGHSVQVFHINDDGVYDYIEIHELVKADGYVYLFDIEFSEVIIDGFVGTWEVTAYNLSVSDSLSFGQTLNASNVTSLPVSVTDDSTKSHPYDINTTGLVGWWKLDDDYLDSSGNGNNGTAYGNNISFVPIKYNNGSLFDGIGDWIVYGNLNIHNESFMVSGFINVSSSLVESLGCILGTDNNSKRFLVYRDSGKLITQFGGNFISINSVSDDTLTYFTYVYSKTTNKESFYLNSVFDSDHTPTYMPSWNEDFYIGTHSPTQYRFKGGIDNICFRVGEYTQTDVDKDYYDHLQQLKIKTNSNSTWSTEWNSTADNPIQVPYADGEFFSLLNFTVPDSVVQNGITIYDYPNTVQLDAVATVGYTEDITKITETASAGTYTLNITHAAGNIGEGYINYTTTNAVLLDADFWNSANLSSDNPNASLSSTLPYFNISTGYVATATEFYYLIEMPYFYPPTGLTATPYTTTVDLDWDDYPFADKYSVYEMEDGFSYVDTNPAVDGIKDAIYDSAHEFLIFSPNPVNTSDYETIYPLRTSLGAYFLIESVDNDAKLGDDDCIYYFDLDNDGLTIDDPAWKITNNIVKKYEWDGASWKVTGVSNAVGASTGGGTHYPIHELFIPIAELGGNWTNGSTVKVLVKREDSSLSPDVITWYPYGNINNTDTSLWQEMVLNDPNTYNLLANVTLSNYTAIDLTPFTIYHGAVSTWNGTDESEYTLFDVITEDISRYNASGYIKDTSGDGIPNATVYSCNGFVHEITTTNESGYWIGYKFYNDTYTICANATGYNANSTSITISGVDLTNVNITLSLSNFDNFTFTNSYLSPTVVRENSPFTVNVDINDTDGTITDAIVKISKNNYTMVNTIGDTWSYTFTQTILPTEYYIQNFYAQDNDGAWNSTTSDLSIFVLSSTGSGSTGGITPVTPPEVEEEEIIEVPEVVEEVISAIGNVTRVLEKMISKDDLLITGINFKPEKSLFTKEFYIEDAVACGFSSNSVKDCNIVNNVATVDVLFNPDTSGLVYHEKTYLTFYNESVGRHTDFDIVIINLMGVISIENCIINNPTTLLFSSDIDNKINGIRMWWIFTIGLIGLVYLVWRNKRE